MSDIAIIGATGLVGLEMLKVLAEYDFPREKISLSASINSVGKKVCFQGFEFVISSVEDALVAKPKVAMFSAGSDLSIKVAEKFAENDIWVVDNSSAWRMNNKIPLIVPEINFQEIFSYQSKIIANPNCATIQLVLPLAAISKKYKIKRLVITTLQSVSGSGMKGISHLQSERNESKEIQKFYPHEIDQNCIPQCDVFLEDKYTKEEHKIINETRKILSMPELAITTTCVRVPIESCHSESVNIEFEQDFSMDEINELIKNFPGIILEDDPINQLYPLPKHSKGKNDVFVGRIRRDFSQANSLNMWIVADNLRKGAATNAVQIALKLLNQN